MDVRTVTKMIYIIIYEIDNLYTLFDNERAPAVEIKQRFYYPNRVWRGS